MNYLRIYKNLILKRRNNPITSKDIYCEKHHIIPHSLGGNNRKPNLIYLTAREHYIAHLLLFKIFLQRAKNPILKLKDQKLNCLYKMAHAFKSMNMSNKLMNRKDYIKNSRLFEIIRLEAHKYSFTYSFDLVKKMFNFYIKNNCGVNKKQYLLLQQTFNYTSDKYALQKLFIKHNFSLSKPKRYDFKIIEKMFNFYVKNNCATNKEQFILLQQKFNYTSNKNTLRQLFKRHNLSLSKQYNFELVEKMFNFYVNNNCATNEEQFLLLKQKFNYKSDKNTLRQLFKRNNFYLSRLTKKQNKNYFQQKISSTITKQKQQDQNYFIFKPQMILNEVCAYA